MPACRGSFLGRVINRKRTLNAKSNDMAPSLAEADEILAAYGYEDRELLAA